MDDLIARAVKKARSLSKNPPRLNKPAAAMVLPEKKVRTIGEETGPDGRRKRRGLGIPQLSDVVRKTIVTQGWEESLGQGWVFGNWADIVGEAVADHCTPDRIDNQILHINCDTSSWATNLRYLQTQVLVKIAETVGDNVVVELRIHGPKQHKNYEGPMWVKPQGSQDTYG